MRLHVKTRSLVVMLVVGLSAFVVPSLTAPSLVTPEVEVLAEAQVVCVGQHFLVVGDLNADPCIIPRLAKGIASGRFGDLALAYSLGADKEPDASCRFKLDECAGTRRGFIVSCPLALAASSACSVTDRRFSRLFSIVAECCIRRWTAEVSCPIATLLVWHYS